VLPPFLPAHGEGNLTLVCSSAMLLVRGRRCRRNLCLSLPLLWLYRCLCVSLNLHLRPFESAKRPSPLPLRALLLEADADELLALKVACLQHRAARDGAPRARVLRRGRALRSSRALKHDRAIECAVLV
jgi:hypothetical protein